MNTSSANQSADAGAVRVDSKIIFHENFPMGKLNEAIEVVLAWAPEEMSECELVVEIYRVLTSGQWEPPTRVVFVVGAKQERLEGWSAELLPDNVRLCNIPMELV